jgi:small subunit ribosomal protein S17
MTATEENKVRQSRRKILQGRVVSDAGDKAVVVEVETRKEHPFFRKMVRRSKRFMAHDQNNECRVGDMVRIMETRPLSKRKRWRLVEVVERAK